MSDQLIRWEEFNGDFKSLFKEEGSENTDQYPVFTGFSVAKDALMKASTVELHPGIVEGKFSPILKIDSIEYKADSLQFYYAESNGLRKLLRLLLDYNEGPFSKTGEGLAYLIQTLINWIDISESSSEEDFRSLFRTANPEQGPENTRYYRLPPRNLSALKSLNEKSGFELIRVGINLGVTYGRLPNRLIFSPIFQVDFDHHVGVETNTDYWHTHHTVSDKLGERLNVDNSSVETVSDAIYLNYMYPCPPFCDDDIIIPEQIGL